jgi:hypothetical protein
MPKRQAPGLDLAGFNKLADELEDEADEAARHVETWLELPNARWAEPGPGHHTRAFGYLRAAGTAGNLTTTTTQFAAIAAIAVGNNATMCSNDGDL